jgi:NADH-quinone oxidoreductase subunit F
MERPLTKNIRPDGKYLGLKAYDKSGGYQALRKALKDMSPAGVQQVVKDSNLRGRGGAGFPTGQKWSFVPMGADAPRPKYLIVNADEMEPGTFKDRLLLEGDPHQIIEGAILSAYAIQADEAYIFLRWAYKLAADRLTKAIAEAYEAGYVGKNILGTGYDLELRLHISAGRYICGEETALLNALEGKRAIPRAKPPFPQVSGLRGKPTIVNNAETISNIPHIINHGAEWFKGLSKSVDSGTKLYGVSGKVKRPGVWELPMGTTIRELMEEHAGGMREGVPSGWCIISFSSSRTSPAAGARPAARVCRGSRAFLTLWRTGRVSRRTSGYWNSSADCWVPAIPFAPLRPAPWSRSRAR